MQPGHAPQRLLAALHQRHRCFQGVGELGIPAVDEPGEQGSAGGQFHAALGVERPHLDHALANGRGSWSMIDHSTEPLPAPVAPTHRTWLPRSLSR